MGVRRTGDHLPICCPRHGSSRDDGACRKVARLCDFPTKGNWGSFCSKPCRSRLPRCQHVCSLPCHCPLASEHQTKCREILQRPCARHKAVLLLCMDVAIKPQQSLEEALESHPCECLETYRRSECEHSVEIRCDVKSMVERGLTSLSPCKKRVGDYINPICNHIIKAPTCIARRQYEEETPLCSETVQHERPCKCVSTMECFEAVAENTNPSLCYSSVECKRPRCGKSF